MRSILVVVSVGLLLIGCGPLEAPDLKVHVANHTIVDAIVSVNGAEVGVLPTGVSGDVPLGGQGGPPYRIEVRSRAGTALGDFLINASDVTGLTSGSSMGGRSETECGSIEFTFGSAGEAAPDPAQAVQADPTLCR